jgi:predicted PurR-regulated permease PerM
MNDVRHNRAMGGLAAIVVLGALWLIHGLLPAILWAGVVAIGLDPLRSRVVTRWPDRRTVIAALMALVVAAVVMIPLAIGMAQAAREAGQVAAWLQKARVEGVPVPNWVGTVPFGADHLSSWWTSHLAEPGAAMKELSRLDASSIAKRSQTIGSNVASRLMAFGFIVTTLFFLLRDRETVIAQLRSGTRRAFGDRGVRIGTHALSSIRGTIDGIVLVGLAQGAIMGIVYAACGVPHPVLLGVLTAIGAMIPFGLVLALAIPVLLLAATGSYVPMGIVLALGLASNFVADHFVRPALIGGATSMPFMWVLFGLIGGLETIGLLGLFVGPAIMAVLSLLWKEWIDPGLETGRDVPVDASEGSVPPDLREDPAR